jgi:hypothetical protein
MNAAGGADLSGGKNPFSPSGSSPSGERPAPPAKPDGFGNDTFGGERGEITVSGGYIHINASGDGIDSNSRSSYQGIIFSGGKTVVISTSGGNSAIDTEQGYDYTGGYVLAVMPSGGMSSEAKRCKNFNSVAQSTSMKLNANEDLKVGDIFNVKIPTSLNALVIFIGDTDAKITAGN